MTTIDDVIIVPFTVIVDSREQAPFHFHGFNGDAPKHLPLVIPTKIAGLQSGDYSIAGYEEQVSVERKSLDDLFNTLGNGRERFERELERLAEMEFAAVVIEADWSTILTSPPPRSKMRPKSVYRSIIAWQQRYPIIHWWPCATKNFAERTTFRMLQRFWLDKQDAPQAKSAAVKKDGKCPVCGKAISDPQIVCSEECYTQFISYDEQGLY